MFDVNLVFLIWFVRSLFLLCLLRVFVCLVVVF